MQTGIEGFDRVIQGGFPKGTVNLISGPAGRGKTLFALHFFLGGAPGANGHSMYLSLEESRASLQRVLESFGMDTAPLEQDSRFMLLDMGELRTGRGDEEKMIGFLELQEFLQASFAKTPIDRLVIDSLSAVGLHYRSLRELRRELFSLVRFLRDKEVTTVLIAESVEGSGLTRWGFEQFVSDSFVHLGLEETKGELRRTITVRKMRFTKHDTVKHPVRITSNGIVVEPDERVV